MAPTLSQIITLLIDRSPRQVAQELGVTEQWLMMVCGTDAVEAQGNQASPGGIESAVDQVLFAPPGWAP